MARQDWYAFRHQLHQRSVRLSTLRLTLASRLDEYFKALPKDPYSGELPVQVRAHGHTLVVESVCGETLTIAVSLGQDALVLDRRVDVPGEGAVTRVFSLGSGSGGEVLVTHRSGDTALPSYTERSVPILAFLDGVERTVLTYRAPS